MDITKEAISKRFVECISDLLDHNSKLSKKEIASTLGLKPNTFSEILNGRMGVSVEILSRFYLNYDIDVIWILTGNVLNNRYLYAKLGNALTVAEKDRNKYENLDVEHYKILNNRLIGENELLRNQNRQLNDIIEDLKTLIEGFKSGHIVITKPKDEE